MKRLIREQLRNANGFPGSRRLRIEPRTRSSMESRAGGVKLESNTIDEAPRIQTASSRQHNIQNCQIETLGVNQKETILSSLGCRHSTPALEPFFESAGKLRFVFNNRMCTKFLIPRLR